MAQRFNARQREYRPSVVKVIRNYEADEVQGTSEVLKLMPPSEWLQQRRPS